MLTSEGTISALRSQDRKHSTRFKVSMFIDPRWSVTVNLDLEKSLSVSVDIGAIDRMSILFSSSLQKRLQCSALILLCRFTLLSYDEYSNIQQRKLQARKGLTLRSAFSLLPSVGARVLVIKTF